MFQLGKLQRGRMGQQEEVWLGVKHEVKQNFLSVRVSDLCDSPCSSGRKAEPSGFSR